MPVVSALSPISLTQFFYASGKIVRPAKLYFYKPQTEDLVVVYQDPTLGVPHEQPVVSGGSGRVPPVYVGTEPYRIRAYDTNGSLIEDIPYLPGAIAPGDTELIEPAAGVYLRTGDMFFAFAAAATQRPGSVRANGGLIGRTGCAHGTSDIIERYNDDTYELFQWLWGQDFGLALAILPSRGGSSAADWADSKAMALPDLRGRTLVGIDGMGLTQLANRLLGVTWSIGAATVSGSTAGVAMPVISLAQMPIHGHGFTGNANADITIDVNLAVSVPYFDISGPNYINQTPGALSHGFFNLSHAHTIVQTPHVHEVLLAGESAAFENIGPTFAAVVYIKL